jgi:hypothetical protein
MIEATGAEDVVAPGANHKVAVKNESFATTASLLGREQVVFHFPDHEQLPVKVGRTTGHMTRAISS